MKPAIELRRIRDFGEIINDSFTFLKENFKPLFRPLIVICGFFVLAGAATTALNQMSMIGTFDSSGTEGTYESSGMLLTRGLSAIVNGVILILAQLSIELITLSYMAVYLQKKDTLPTLPEVWGFYKYYFLRVLGSGFVITLLFFLGVVLCVIPGIYLMAPLALIFPIIVMENASFSYSFSKAFRIIKDNWWVVFGVIFVTTLIVGVLGSVASVPLALIGALKKFLPLKGLALPLIVLFSILQNILMLGYVLPAIAVSMCYFSLNEQKDGTGIMDRIEMFGKTAHDSDHLPAEEY